MMLLCPPPSPILTLRYVPLHMDWRGLKAQRCRVGVPPSSQASARAPCNWGLEVP